jgi:plasmid stabilization system protein ParE
VARPSPQERLENVVLSCGVDDGYWSDAALQRLDIQRWMVDELREAEASVRRLRGRLEAAMNTDARRCDHCGELLGGRADRRTCSNPCRQAVFRKRQHSRLRDEL